ncbi:MAG: hypothetical protein AAGF20_00790 [Pseudomonadota bacterium]
MTTLEFLDDLDAKAMQAFMCAGLALPVECNVDGEIVSSDGGVVFKVVELELAEYLVALINAHSSLVDCVRSSFEMPRRTFLDK